MRRVFRGIGWILLVLALGLLSHDLIAWVRSGTFEATDVGALWFAIHRDSLQLAEPAIARYLHPYLWHPIITTVLLAPAFLVAGGLAIILLLLTRARTYSRPSPGDLFR